MEIGALAWLAESTVDMPESRGASPEPLGVRNILNWLSRHRRGRLGDPGGYRRGYRAGCADTASRRDGWLSAALRPWRCFCSRWRPTACWRGQLPGKHGTRRGANRSWALALTSKVVKRRHDRAGAVHGFEPHSQPARPADPADVAVGREDLERGLRPSCRRWSGRFDRCGDRVDLGS